MHAGYLVDAYLFLTAWPHYWCFLNQGQPVLMAFQRTHSYIIDSNFVAGDATESNTVLADVSGQIYILSKTAQLLNTFSLLKTRAFSLKIDEDNLTEDNHAFMLFLGCEDGQLAFYRSTTR